MRRRIPFQFPLLLICVLLFGGGCEEKVVKTGAEVPAISGKDLAGNRVSSESLKGNVVVIFFWTNSCCGGRLKDDVEPVFRRNRDKGVAFITVNEGDGQKEVTALAKRDGLTIPILLDGGASLMKDFGVFGFPTTFIVDNKGILRQKILGPVSGAKLEQIVLRQVEMQKKAAAAYERSR